MGEQAFWKQGSGVRCVACGHWEGPGSDHATAVPNPKPDGGAKPRDMTTNRATRSKSEASGYGYSMAPAESELHAKLARPGETEDERVARLNASHARAPNLQRRTRGR